MLPAQVLVELFCGAPTVSAVPWALTTFIILVVTYSIAMVVPNIWPVMVSGLFPSTCFTSGYKLLTELTSSKNVFQNHPAIY